MNEVIGQFETGQIDAVIMAVLLGLARLQAFFYASPFFGSRGIPRTVRLALIMALSMFAAPVSAQVFLDQPDIRAMFFTLALKELVIGFFLGMLTWLPLRGFELTGVILDTQRGSTIAQDFDVIFNAQTTPTSIFLSQVFNGFFFASGGFLVVQTMLFNSFDFWPLTAPLPQIEENAVRVFLKFGGQLFFTAVALALPIVAFNLLADIAIAYLAKTAPTLNALTFGMPVKSLINIIMLIFYIDVAYPKVFLMFQTGLVMLDEIFGS